MTELSTPTFSSDDSDDDERAMKRIPVDAEHLGIRILLPLLAFVAFVFFFWATPQALDSIGFGRSQSGLIALPIAFGAAIGVAFLGDRLLKRYWPSSRMLLLDDRRLVLRRPGHEDDVIHLDTRINLLTWRFKVPRRGRVPKGHWCLGLQLLQDDRLITIYNFLPHKETHTIKDYQVFVQLVSSRKRADSRDVRAGMRESGQQRRLLKAESERWQNGAELTQEDFTELWAEIKQYGVSMVV